MQSPRPPLGPGQPLQTGKSCYSHQYFSPLHPLESGVLILLDLVVGTAPSF